MDVKKPVNLPGQPGKDKLLFLNVAGLAAGYPETKIWLLYELDSNQ